MDLTLTNQTGQHPIISVRLANSTSNDCGMNSQTLREMVRRICTPQPACRTVTPLVWGNQNLSCKCVRFNFPWIRLVIGIQVVIKGRHFTTEMLQQMHQFVHQHEPKVV